MSDKKVLVGMSGGVDSSVAALLLRQSGYDVTGVTLKLQPEKYGSTHEQDIIDARCVAEKIGIRHIVVDFTRLFEEKVINNFIEEYCNGRTPNPCIVCNKFLKFGAMFDYAMEHGFDYIATGHYARIEFDKSINRWLLKRVSCSKDQSYVLYNLTQNQLAHVLFPLAKLEKTEIRQIAEKFALPIAKKPDSQEICFVPDKNYVGFIRVNSKMIHQPGNFVDGKGKVLGKHNGILNYTIGQRKGLGISFGKPMYVIGINADNNTVILGQEGEQYSNELTAGNLNFIPFDFPTQETSVMAKIRYQAQLEPAKILPLNKNKVKVVFKNSQRSITPGQSVVFYKGDVVIGGGVII